MLIGTKDGTNIISELSKGEIRNWLNKTAYILKDITLLLLVFFDITMISGDLKNEPYP